jgi:ferredoxin--NADP+ reductase
MDPDRYHRIEFVDRVDFSDDLALFRFEAETPVDFVPGQYATLGLETPEQDRPLLRPYSVVNAPNSRELEFFVELVDEGKLTPRLWDLAPGAEAWMRKKVTGRFVLDTDYRQHVMAATVTGVGPYVSIVRAQQRALKQQTQDAPHRMLILHGGSRSWELGTYREELSALAEAVDWLRYVPTVSRPWEDPDWDGEVGRVEDVLRKHIDATGFDPAETAAYTCGHPKMIDKAQGIFERAGFSEDAIHEEKYFVDR